LSSLVGLTGTILPIVLNTCQYHRLYSPHSLLFHHTSINRVIKKSLCIWWLRYKTHAQSDCLAADRQGQGDSRLTLTPSVIPNSNCVIMVCDWNCLKYFYLFLCCNHQVHRDFFITLYIHKYHLSLLKPTHEFLNFASDSPSEDRKLVARCSLTSVRLCWLGTELRLFGWVFRKGVVIQANNRLLVERLKHAF
jgi:hypothetical protein